MKVKMLLASMVLGMSVLVFPGAASAQSDTSVGPGDNGADVERAQELLNQFLALSASAVPLIAEDGVFGPQTTAAVEEFERVVGEPVDGVLPLLDRLRLEREVDALEEALPASVIRAGDAGPVVMTWQDELNAWSRLTGAPLPIEDDGVFGPATDAATRAFEGSIERQVDGIVEPVDRRAMRRVLVALRAEAGDLPPLSIGDAGDLVADVQLLVNDVIAFADLDIPLLVDDGVYGRLTRDAVAIVEASLGRADDGVASADDIDAFRLAVAALESAAAPSVISEGDVGPLVESWQRRVDTWLRLSGEQDRPAIDAVFGPSTDASTRRAEAELGLQVDGLVEPEDRVALTADIERLRALRDDLVVEADSLGDLVTADDFTSGDADLLRLYTIFFDRQPDLAGAKYWIAQARAGVPFRTIAEQFAASSEFDGRYGDLPDGAFVDAVYRNALERTPDAPGRAYWIGRLDAGDSPAVVVLGFAFAIEFIDQNRFGGL